MRASQNTGGINEFVMHLTHRHSVSCRYSGIMLHRPEEQRVLKLRDSQQMYQVQDQS